MARREWNFTARSGSLPRADGFILPREQDCLKVLGLLMKDKCVAVGGPPGVGKTVLLALVTSRNKVKNKFTDGVYWLRVCPQTTAFQRQLQLIHLLISNTASYSQFTDYGFVENSHTDLQLIPSIQNQMIELYVRQVFMCFTSQQTTHSVV